MGLAVEGGAGSDVAGNIGDVDADLGFAGRGDFVGKGVVEIFGVVRIDCEDGQLAVVEAAGGIFGGHAVGEEGGLALDVGGETGG